MSHTRIHAQHEINVNLPSYHFAMDTPSHPIQYDQIVVQNQVNCDQQVIHQVNPQVAYGGPYVNYASPQLNAVNPSAPLQNYNNVPNIPNVNVQWMPRPEVMGCPPGLEYLTLIDQLLVHQQIELFEILSGYETNNKYILKNVCGQQIYYAKEDTDCCIRNTTGPSRPFVIHVLDNMNYECIQIRRPLTCTCFGQCFSCSECCQDEVQVEAPPGQIVGYVKQLYEGCEVRYSICNENREIVLRLHGPNYFKCYCPGDEFPLQLLSADGSVELGRVSKQWSNLVKELFTDADNFGIQFPIDLDVKIKAVIIGSVFLLDFMYFEQSNNRNQRHH